MRNKDIRRAIFDADLKHWQIASALGMSEATLSRKLRTELPDEEKQKILQAINEIKGIR